MPNINEIKAQLALLLAQEISLRDFSRWFVPNSWNLQKEDEAYALAEAIEDQLVQFEVASEELRERLRQIYDSFNVAINESAFQINVDDAALVVAQPTIHSEGKAGSVLI